MTWRGAVSSRSSTTLHYITSHHIIYDVAWCCQFPELDHVVVPWPGGCRAGGAAWQSTKYTREGLADTSRLRHALQADEA